MNTDGERGTRNKEQGAERDRSAPGRSFPSGPDSVGPDDVGGQKGARELGSGPSTLHIRDLGLMDYGQALTLQRDLRERRLAGDAPDALLLVEHPPTFTLGRRSRAEEFTVAPELLRAQGFAVYEIERGGKTTYHGPGQLVAYPIVSLRDLGLGVPEYVGLLERCVIDYLASLGLVADRRTGYPGVWVQGRKIAAIGVHLRQWVSIHGFALNLSPDLAHFGAIVPCGLPDVQVTSVAAELGHAPSMEDAKSAIGHTFARLAGYAPAAWDPGPAASAMSSACSS